VKAIIGTATTGLPALAGVLLGIRTFTGNGYWLAGDLAIVAVGYALLGIGNLILPSSPRIGRWFVEVWIISSIGTMALATYAILYISLKDLPNWLGPVAGDERTKAVTSAFAGAITAYIALVWTKDITEGQGHFWPSTQFKNGLERAWKKMTRQPQPGSIARQAMFDDYIEGEGDVGWDFSDRQKRADIVDRFLQGDPSVA